MGLVDQVDGYRSENDYRKDFRRLLDIRACHNARELALTKCPTSYTAPNRGGVLFIWMTFSLRKS